jgi:hypothetical protein
MNIGFFGDSYVDITKSKWPGDLLNDMGSPAISSGMGGANQYYAVDTWNQVQERLKNSTTKLDYAIWTFTWHQRLYRGSDRNVPVVEMLAAWAEKRQPTQSNDNAEEINNAITSYFKYIRDDNESLFYYTLMLKWILDLPAQYPNTKFIFIPNTEVSKDLALNNFSQGVLLDFAFETLSNRETGSPCTMPCDCKRIGHLNTINHDRVKDMIKNIIINYNQYQNKIYTVDYNQFDVVY